MQSEIIEIIGCGSFSGSYFATLSSWSHDNSRTQCKQRHLTFWEVRPFATGPSSRIAAVPCYARTMTYTHVHVHVYARIVREQAICVSESERRVSWLAEVVHLGVTLSAHKRSIGTHASICVRPNMNTTRTRQFAGDKIGSHNDTRDTCTGKNMSYGEGRSRLRRLILAEDMLRSTPSVRLFQQVRCSKNHNAHPRPWQVADGGTCAQRAQAKP